MYMKSRNVLDCHIAGFKYYDGLEVIDSLKIGSVVNLASEPENPYDPDAVAVYFDGRKLGYIPRCKNSTLSSFLYFGYGDIFEARICEVNLKENPEQQLGIVVKLKDNRKT